MSPDSLIIIFPDFAFFLLSLAICITGFLLFFLAYHLSKASEVQSISTYESDHALDTEKVEAPQTDHQAVWENQHTWHELPAWPPIYNGPTVRARAMRHRNLETNIGSSQNGL